MSARTSRENKQQQQQNESFFLPNFNDYINLDNREGARARYDNGHQFRWKKNMKII